jgi:hypothetical protein
MICQMTHIKVWMCVLEQLEQLRHVIMYLQSFKFEAKSAIRQWSCLNLNPLKALL